MGPAGFGALTRRLVLRLLSGLPAWPLFRGADALAAIAGDPLPSWSDGPAKAAIINLVRTTTDVDSPNFVAPESRIATFDQDGTTWVEHPIYTQVVYALARVPAVVAAQPELKHVEPFETVLSGDSAAIARLSTEQFLKILTVTLSGMTVEQFHADAAQWLATAKHPRWDRLYTELTYLPMLEAMRFLRANDYKTYIVTGGGQDFVRAYSQRVYGIAPEQVIGSAGVVKFGYADGKPMLTKEPALLLNDNYAGKPESIYLEIGERPVIAFGNSTGDQQMLEYANAGDGARAAMIILHDDAEREYAYGPAQGLPDTKIGAFPQDLYDEATTNGWHVISMKRDWKKIFAFE